MSDYTLRMSETELERYRMRASFAAAAEEAAWAEAGIVPGTNFSSGRCTR